MASAVFTLSLSCGGTVEGELGGSSSALAASASPATAYWGVRNLQAQWTSTEAALGAHYAADTMRWSELEPVSGHYDWSKLDVALGQINSIHAQPILVLGCDSPWATSGSTDGDTAPTDLNRTLPLNGRLNSPGFSTSLYTFTRAYVAYVLQSSPSGQPPIFRFENEPAGHWHTDTADLGARGIDDYLRSLRTFALAAHDEAAAEHRTIYVSHGGMNYEDFLFEAWYAEGSSTLPLYQSFWERWNAGQPQNWAAVDTMMHRAERRISYAWTNAFVESSLWVDFHDVHYHFKPRYLGDVMHLFRVREPTPTGHHLPWIACEEAMRVHINYTDYRFQAGDMVRKWITGLAEGLTGFATPIIGSNAGSTTDDWIGLYKGKAPGDRLPAADSYIFVRGLVHGDQRPRDLSDGNLRHYRFYQPPVDVLWHDALRDADTTVDTPTVTPPIALSGAATVEDILGAPLRTVAAGTPSFKLSVGQEPQIIVWAK